MSYPDLYCWFTCLLSYYCNYLSLVSPLSSVLTLSVYSGNGQCPTNPLVFSSGLNLFPFFEMTGWNSIAGFGYEFQVKSFDKRESLGFGCKCY